MLGIACFYLYSFSFCLPKMSTYLFPLRWESTGDQWWYASPIDWAAANGHYDLVRELLRLDPNHLIKLTSRRRIQRLETLWYDDQQQFHHVAGNRSKVARKLFDLNSLIGAGWVLYTAASAGDLTFVRELLDRDPLLVFGQGEYGVTDVLYAAARSKDSEVFKLVLDFAMSVPGAYKSEIMNRAVHALARGGNLQLLKELLGGDDGVLAHRDNRGSTILHAAAARGQVEVVKYLTSSSSKSPSWDIVDNHGNTALHVAAHRGHLRAVEALVVASPSLIHARNDSGATFLHCVISGFRTPGFRRLDRQIELMKHLLGNGLFNVKEIINVEDNQGQTALHLAVSGNIHSDLVELLMAVDSVDVNIRDINGMTPLDILKKRPAVSDSSESSLTRQLLSAGGIFSRQDYMARRAIAWHIKRQSMGNSPGTSFRINDAKMFLFTDVSRRVEIVSQHGSDPGSSSSSPKEAFAQHLKDWIRWPKMRNKISSDRLKNLACEEIPIPLRQRFSKAASSLSNYKRRRSNSPMAKKSVPNNRSSRSSSFSKLSLSSVDMPIKDNTTTNDEGKSRHRGLVRKRLVNQCLCFGDPRQAVEASTTDLY